MTDGEHVVPFRRWLADDLFVLNTLFLVAATALALALTSSLWHYIHPEPRSLDQQRPDSAPSIFSTALAHFRDSLPRAVPSTGQQQSLVVLAPEQKDRKSTRSKERRRRGKDPFRDLLKSGKKSKALLKSVKTTDLDHTLPEDDTASSTSRSQSPDPARNLDCPVLRMGVDSDDGGVGNTAPNGNASSTSTVTLSSDVSDRASPDACSQEDAIHPLSVPSDPMISVDTHANISSTSMVTGHAPEDAPSSPPIPTACAAICTLQPRNSQAASVSGNCAKLVRARTRLRLSRIETSVKSPLSSSTQSALPDSVETLSPPIRSDMPCPPLSIIPSTLSTDGAGPSTPTNSRGSTPPSQSLSPSEDPSQGGPSTQPLDRSTTAAQIQLASMHGALEAARLREEKLRVVAEQASKECDELRWRWSEDAGLWRRREAELQAQIYHLTQQLQAYAAVASFQAQQVPSSGFSSPTSPHAHSSLLLQHHSVASFPLPPGIRTQNSASAPAHVQALLASAPMLASHPPGYAAPASTGLYSGTDLGRSPLLWSGLGLCIPERDSRQGGRRTPDSSASGSPRNQRRRQYAENGRSASDESSLGEWDGTEDGSGDEDLWEEEEDVFRNNALADAILKRPESIRKISGSVGKRPGMWRGRPLMHGVGEVSQAGVGGRMDTLKDPALGEARIRTTSH